MIPAEPVDRIDPPRRRFLGAAAAAVTAAQLGGNAAEAAVPALPAGRLPESFSSLRQVAANGLDTG